jgi:hypothetical protein
MLLQHEAEFFYLPLLLGQLASKFDDFGLSAARDGSGRFKL